MVRNKQSRVDDLKAVVAQMERDRWCSQALAALINDAHQQRQGVEQQLGQVQQQLAQVQQQLADTHANLQAHQAQNPSAVDTAIQRVSQKAQAINALGADAWSEAHKSALGETVNAFKNTGPCDWCGQRGHESTSCWVGAQAWRNGESRKVSVGGEMTNPWTYFKRCLQFQRSVDDAAKK